MKTSGIEKTETLKNRYYDGDIIPLMWIFVNYALYIYLIPFGTTSRVVCFF